MGAQACRCCNHEDDSGRLSSEQTAEGFFGNLGGGGGGSRGVGMKLRELDGVRRSGEY